jgi:hypothetical protein
MNRELDSICARTVSAFPQTRAILHWGGARMRGHIAAHGDVDILIVVDDKVDVRAEALLKLKKKFRNIDLEPLAIRKRDLKVLPLVAMGPHGPYEMHELIHYQLKHESDVIYGDKKVLKLIPPMSLGDAMKAILPYIRKGMIPRVLDELERLPVQRFIDLRKDVLLVTARTIYSVREKKLATKEQALEYIGKKFSSLRRLADFLLKKYRSKKSAPYPGAKEDIRKLLLLARRRNLGSKRA